MITFFPTVYQVVITMIIVVIIIYDGYDENCDHCNGHLLVITSIIVFFFNINYSC